MKNNSGLVKKYVVLTVFKTLKLINTEIFISYY